MGQSPAALPAPCLTPLPPLAHTRVQGAVLAAMLAPTDAVAVTAILKAGGGPEAMVVIMEGEALLNDASAVTLYTGGRCLLAGRPGRRRLLPGRLPLAAGQAPHAVLVAGCMPAPCPPAPLQTTSTAACHPPCLPCQSSCTS